MLKIDKKRTEKTFFTDLAASLKSMPRRMQAVVNAQGGHTKY